MMEYLHVDLTRYAEYDPCNSKVQYRKRNNFIILNKQSVCPLKHVDS